MIQKFKCPNCSQEFTSEQVNTGKCPDCRRWLDYVGLVGVDGVQSPIQTSPSKRSEATLSQLVAAQDRTTFAVRSLAMFLFTSLVTTGSGYVLIVSGAGGFGVFVIIVGYLAALALGIMQLINSKP
jgi:predicted ATP-dependent serine protease